MNTQGLYLSAPPVNKCGVTLALGFLSLAADDRRYKEEEFSLSPAAEHLDSGLKQK